MKFLSAIFFLFSLRAYSGEKQSFDWRELPGQYQYVSCENNGIPVWVHSIENYYIHIREDRSVPQNHLLAMYLHRKDSSPLALRWPIDYINLGLHKVRDGKGQVYSRRETFTDLEGLSSFSHWDNGKSRGWSQLRLSWLEPLVLKYEMILYRNTEKILKKESCVLKKKNG